MVRFANLLNISENGFKQDFGIRDVKGLTGQTNCTADVMCAHDVLLSLTNRCL